MIRPIITEICTVFDVIPDIVATWCQVSSQTMISWYELAFIDTSVTGMKRLFSIQQAAERWAANGVQINPDIHEPALWGRSLHNYLTDEKIDLDSVHFIMLSLWMRDSSTIKYEDSVAAARDRGEWP